MFLRLWADCLDDVGSSTYIVTLNVHIYDANITTSYHEELNNYFVRYHRTVSTVPEIYLISSYIWSEKVSMKQRFSIDENA
jgi:hypothetical protein